jgi:short-subunit dehydrogenase
VRIEGRTALVTGASSGIGAATARALAREGARVLLLARTRAALEQVAGEIRAAGGAAEAHPVDLGEAEAVERLFDALEAREVRPEIVVNSAGAGRWLFTEETTPDEAVQMMALPYFAAFFVTRRCLPAMLARRNGHIVNINSPVARLGWPGAAGYSAARHALHGFTHALRLDLHGTGVGVTSVVPGKVSSEYFDRNPGVLARAPRVARLIATVTPEQVAEAVIGGIRHNRREVVLPAMLRAFFALNAVAPLVTEWLAVWSGHRHQNQRP